MRVRRPATSLQFFGDYFSRFLRAGLGAWRCCCSFCGPFTMAGILFEDIFDVKDIDPEGKKFDRGKRGVRARPWATWPPAHVAGRPSLQTSSGLENWDSELMSGRTLVVVPPNSGASCNRYPLCVRCGTVRDLHTLPH